MVSDTLHKVAKRIGMVRMGDGWADPPSCLVSAGDSTLRTYLLTGDRPLRIQVEFKISVNWNWIQLHWFAYTYAGENENLHVDTKHPTPAEAILACAEAVCSTEPPPPQSPPP
jgi:hypothetical protein